MKKKTNVHFWNLKGFDLNFLGKHSKSMHKTHFTDIQLAKLRLDFYHNKKKINSCEDILNSNITYIKSIFQVRSNHIKVKNDDYKISFTLRNVEFKENICPLVFNNSIINNLVLIDVTDTFYKKNVLSFTNETFGYLESDIKKLQLHKVQNINLDLKLLNPWVFNKTKTFFIVS